VGVMGVCGFHRSTAPPLHWDRTGRRDAGAPRKRSFSETSRCLMRPISMNCWRTGGVGQGREGERSRWGTQDAAGEHRSCRRANFGPASLCLSLWSYKKSRTSPLLLLMLLRVKGIAGDRTLRMGLDGPEANPSASELISVRTWKEVGFQVRVRRFTD
jgi:hypothetical protein